MRERLRRGMLAGVGIAVSLSLLFAGAVSAGGSYVGESFRISDRVATADDDSPAVAWNSADNQYLVVWSDERDYPTRYSDIYGQRVSAAGSLIGPNFRISGPGGVSGEGYPAVAWNGTSHEYLVVWLDLRNLATRGEDIYGQRVSANGSLAGGNFLVSGPGATSGDAFPDVAWNGTANEYLVVWEDERNSATRGADIYGQRVSATGSLVGANRRISGPNATSDDRFPAVAWNGTANQYLVVWADERNSATRGTDVYGQRASATGSRVGGDFRVSGAGAMAYDGTPDVAWNGTANQYLVVWEDARDRSSLGVDVYGQRLSATGSRVKANFRVGGVANAWSQDAYPMVAWNGTANQYLVVWEDGRDYSTRDLDVYGQRLSATGSPVLVNFRVGGATSTAKDREPAVAWNGTANEYLVVWSDWRSLSTRGRDIYGQRLTG